jgi:DNA-binding GntR family transcriptional regulator
VDLSIPEMQSLRTARVADSAYETLHRHILSGQLVPGQKLTVEELSNRLGISRTPVHDALLKLSGEGLVRIVPRKGTFVSELTPSDVERTMDVRRALELLACETAVQHLDEPQLQRIKGLHDEMAAMRGAPDNAVNGSLHDEKNREFHLALVELADNQLLLDIYRRLNAHLTIARAHAGAPTWKHRLPVELEEHEAVVAALEARDVDRLKSALDRHLRRSTASLIGDVAARSHS